MAHVIGDPAALERVRLALELGATRTLAAQAAGVSRTTFYRWLHEGQKEDGDPWCRELVAMVEAAEGQGAVRALDVIVAAAQEGQWQAAAWLLERRHGYLRTERRESTATVAVTGLDLGQLAAMTPEQLRALAGADDAPPAPDDADEE